MQRISSVTSKKASKDATEISYNDNETANPLFIFSAHCSILPTFCLFFKTQILYEIEQFLGIFGSIKDILGCF